MNLMHVCMISPSLYPFAIGGPNYVSTFLSRALGRLGIRVSLIFSLPAEKEFRQKEMTSIMGEFPNVVFVSTPLFDRTGQSNRLQLFLSRTMSILDDYDIFHFQMYPGVFQDGPLLPLLRIHRDSLVLTYHGPVLHSISHALKPWKSRRNSEFLRVAYFLLTRDLFKKYVTPSLFMKRWMISEGFSENDIQIIPHGVDVDMYMNAKPLHLEGNPALLWVGYTNWEKGSDLALESFKRLLNVFPESRLHYVGYSNAKLLSDINQLGIKGKVIIHGLIPPTVMPSFYKGADICINPSRWESFSIVNLEGMAAAKPIVTTNAGAMPEVVEHNVSGLVVKQDSESMGAALKALCRDRELAQRLGQNALLRAKTFDWSIIASKHLALYKIITEELS